jgi:thioester reductase-like protein
MAGGLVFFTGFPGFIGHSLIGRLLADDPEVRVVALVEERVVEDARRSATELDAERVEVVGGDIGERRLGLDDDQYERLAGEMTAAFHLAAIYDLAVPWELAQRVNVDGTGNVLDLCAAAERLERLNYVSTAYVAGDRRGVVYEHELSLGQGFGNHYESTKFQAEVWVRAVMDRVPVTIYRPGIVVGDSRTGRTQKFDGPYYVLRVVSRAQSARLPVPQFGRAAPFNLVPVDFVVDALAAASADPRAVGETLHLVDPEPADASEVIALLSRELAGREPDVRVSPKLLSQSLRLKAVRGLFDGVPRETLRYLNHPVRFDTRRAEAVLEPHGLRCPALQDYVGPMVAFYREHEHDPEFSPHRSG